LQINLNEELPFRATASCYGCTRSVRMPRSTHEARRDPAARATDDSATDEGLGLLPTGESTGAETHRVEVIDEETDLTTTPHRLDGTDAALPDLEPSLMDQEILTDPMAASGSPDELDDPVAEGDEVYVPPMDPVVRANAHGDAQVLGGFSTSADDSMAPRRSASDGKIGDEALVDAVQSALRRDASTTDLDIEVTVERGIVRLRGMVSGIEDVDNAESVAGQVEGVTEVVEELQVAGL
jgi:hypothetical protein